MQGQKRSVSGILHRLRGGAAVILQFIKKGADQRLFV
jgi:hypothetical protein